MSQITTKTRSEIIKITTFLTKEFHKSSFTDLEAICNDEGLKVIVDDYGKYFDGMLVWDNQRFNIHLNSGKGNLIDSNRGRFTLAHELGHYFLEAHNYAIKTGELKPHPSNIGLFHYEKMEAEADYFASCLLMPRERLRNFTGGKKFSLDIIKSISDVFKVSLTSALIRFAEVGTHGVLVVFCENNIVKWYCKSEDFPMLSHKFRIGQQPPPTSVLGESFIKSDSKYTSVQEVNLEDWFYDREGAPTWTMYEQCSYSDLFNYAISVIWFR